jgi:hypothetical protein
MKKFHGRVFGTDKETKNAVIDVLKGFPTVFRDGLFAQTKEAHFRVHFIAAYLQSLHRQRRRIFECILLPRMYRGEGSACALEVLENGRHVSHDGVPVRSLLARHAVDVERGGNARPLGHLEGESEVTPLVRGTQLAEGHPVRQVGVQEGAQGEPVVPAAREVGDLDLRVARCLRLAPFEQRVPLGAAGLAYELRQGVPGSEAVPAHVMARRQEQREHRGHRVGGSGRVQGALWAGRGRPALVRVPCQRVPVGQRDPGRGLRLRAVLWVPRLRGGRAATQRGPKGCRGGWRRGRRGGSEFTCDAAASFFLDFCKLFFSKIDF